MVFPKRNRGVSLCNFIKAFARTPCSRLLFSFHHSVRYIKIKVSYKGGDGKAFYPFMLPKFTGNVFVGLTVMARTS